jgi:parvulin-like peptidyl-prolyl isomerase
MEAFVSGGFSLKVQIAAFLVALTSLASAQLDPNKTIVSINGEEVKAGEYYRRMEFLPGVGKMMGNSFAQFPPGLLTIEQLITERLVFQMAKEKGILPTDEEVKDEIAFNTKADPDYLKSWDDAGRTRDELAYQTKFELTQFKLVTQGINVTNAEIDDFYTKNRTIFTVPKIVTLRVIAVDSPEAAKGIDADLAAGKSFEEVAKAKSLDVSAILGGDFGKRSFDDLAKVVRDALDKVKVGGVTEWISGDGKTQVKFKLQAAEPSYVKPLDDILRRKIRREQMFMKGNIQHDIRKDMNAARRKAQITITQKEFADAYKKFIDTFLSSGGN